ncbi:MAG TPA: hypothetical protein VMF09_09510 [Solirubrobacteraceae bacterium]|nr:hypothetical protein [Solirubrobacteraceae bacterium]
MASSGKKKTTMAKLARESRLRERRIEKQAKRDARKLAPGAHRDEPSEALASSGPPVSLAADRAALQTVRLPSADASD